MRTISVIELKKELKTVAVQNGIRLWKGNRVYNVKPNGEGWRGMVLAEQPLPHVVEFHDSGKGLEWACDCGESRPCDHLWAVAIKLYEAGNVYLGQLRNAFANLTAPAGKMSIAGGKAAEFELFEDGYYQPSLFDARPIAGPPSQSGTHSPQVAFAGEPLADSTGIITPKPSERPRQSEALRRPQNGFRARGITIRKAMMHKPELLVELSSEGPGPAFNNDEEAWSGIVDSLQTREQASKLPGLPLGSILAVIMAASNLGPEIVRTGQPERAISVVAVRGVRIGARFAKAGADGRARYAPLISFDLVVEADRTGRPLSDQERLDFIGMNPQSVATEGGTVYVLSRNVLAVLARETAVSATLARLKNLAGPVSGIEFETIRTNLSGKTSIPIEVEVPTGERFEHRLADPRVIVSFRAALDRTELFISFSYEGVETEANRDEDDLGRVLEDGTTIVYHRQRDRESASMVRVREILGDNIAFERGLYAGLLADRQIADMTLGIPAPDFIMELGRRLMEAGCELRTEGRPVRGTAGLGFRAESGVDWFGFKATWQSETGHGLLRIDDSMDRYGMAPAADDEGEECWIILARRDIERLKLLRRMGMDKEGLLETSPINITLIDSLYSQIENQDEAHIAHARVLGEGLAHRGAETPDGLVAPPLGLKTTLRPYQLQGYNWLVYLNHHKLGGCLADDMGLGKTVQTIALLQHLREQGILGPSLIIGPVVTLPNWEDELARFAPELRVVRHAGQDRAQTIDKLLCAATTDGDPLSTRSDYAGLSENSGPPIVLVSYHTLRNDLDLFVQGDWDYVILDEAHYIKNAGSQIYKAIRVLPSRHRLSLTGTPIENSTLELWSQFSFLNPGLLGSRRSFQSDIAMPIEKGGDETTVGILRDTISPFILRRRKQEVLEDLPPKEELLYWTEMAPDQAVLYASHRDRYRDQLAGIIQDKGVRQSSMDIFRFMLRLRQLAIHPALASPDDPTYARTSSCKLEALRMLLDESLQEDHKMLIFSQFVSALRLIGADLDATGRRYALITGATADRRAEVAQFRDDPDLRLFLLSLKAGGVGINLTSADYVVLFDPWWNPAAERQAVDRAHRIGQQKPVLVYKFITKGTIEEKILQLQQKKHKLVGSLIAGDDKLISDLSENDVMGLFE